MNGVRGLPWFAFRSFRYAPDGDGGGAPAAVATPETAPGDPSAIPELPPRDPKGRFTKEAIERAAGLAPETQAAAVPPVPPETPSAPATVAPLPDPDADLAALDAFTNTAGPTAEPPSAPVTPEAPTAPAVSQQQQPQIPQEVLTYASMAQRIESAASSGNAEAVLSMFAPEFVDRIADHLYRQSPDKWAQRYANEANGIQQDPRVEQLQRAFAELQQGIQQRQQTEEQQRTQVQQAREYQQTRAKVQSHIDGLFGSVKMDPAHRAWIEPRLLAEVAKVQNAPQNIRAGRYGDINKVFRDLYVGFRPLLQASASTAQPAPQPSGTAALMATPSGTTTTQAPDASNPKSYSDTSGSMPVDWLKTKLKKIVG